MSLPLQRLLALSLGSVLALVPAVPVKLVLGARLGGVLLPTFLASRPGQSDSPRLAEEAPARKEQILVELERLGGHPWAGVYRGPGFWPDELSLSPDAGFAVYHETGCGICTRWTAVGRVTPVDATTLTLHVELDDGFLARRGVQEQRAPADTTLHLVRWGELRFAVLCAEMERFCATVTAGRRLPDAPFLVLSGSRPEGRDDPPRPAGRPELPSEHARLVPDRPIECDLVALLETRRVESDPDRVVAVFALDAGSSAGLAEGMRLFVEGVRWSGRVEQVEPSRAHLRLALFDGYSPRAQLLVGARATTTAPPEEQ